MALRRWAPGADAGDMRQFSFQLRIPDGRVVTAEVSTESWQWADAFSLACRRVEADLDITPNAGIICIGYTSVPDPFAAAAA